jgi:hypothetical protein
MIEGIDDVRAFGFTGEGSELRYITLDIPVGPATGCFAYVSA